MADARLVPPEVLSPAGDEERLRAALLYGADAVYMAGTAYGMRTAPQNFDADGLRRATEYVHAAGKRIYITCNILPRNEDMAALPSYLQFLNDLRVDALIVADLGLLTMAKRYAPDVPLHISTQLGVFNYETARFLHELGAKRVVLARELSLREIAEIREKTPQSLELEAFVHGAMCMSVSGRCVISDYLTGREANRGACTQPCRWRYQIIEPHRPDKPMTVEETDEGTYLFNAQDMNMIEHVAALARAGISSFKIEGRAKAAYYTAVTAAAYRAAVDGYAASGFSPTYVPEKWITEELSKVSHRPYGTGFYFGKPHQDTVSGGYVRSYAVVGVVEGYKDGMLQIAQRNRFFCGDTLDVLEPHKKPFLLPVEKLFDGDGNAIDSAPHAAMKLQIPFDRPLTVGSILRLKIE